MNFAFKPANFTRMIDLVPSRKRRCAFLQPSWIFPQASSIKVYLSAVRSFHIKRGFPDLLFNCLSLQRVVRGIKRFQGAASTMRLPVTYSIVIVIFKSLDLALHYCRMFGPPVPLYFLAFCVHRNLLCLVPTVSLLHVT